MTVECTPAVARSVASGFAGAAATVRTATATLSSTAAANGTSDLIVGVPLLSSECVEEIELIATVLENLASAVEHADIFSGAGDYFLGAANDALALLLGSLSDGVGDFGGGTPTERRDRIINDLWPDGVPAGISDEELVDRVMNHPRAATMTAMELAEIWPTLPAAGRATFAEVNPVVVLDLVADGGLPLTQNELDVVTDSIVNHPPTLPIPVDPALQAQLDAAGRGRWGLPDLDRVGNALERADILAAAGQRGVDYRDAVNQPVTYLALVMGLQAGGSARRTDDGLIVVTVPRGATVDTSIFVDVGPSVSVQPYGKGGTTFGNTFIVPDGKRISPELLHHEGIHTYQWAGAGPVEYPILYGAESVKSGVHDLVENGVHIDTIRVDVGPLGPDSTPGIDLPGPSWIPSIPSIDLPQFDPPAIPVPYDVDVDLDPNTGCFNRFEQHADLADGGYASCAAD